MIYEPFAPAVATMNDYILMGFGIGLMAVAFLGAFWCVLKRI